MTPNEARRLALLHLHQRSAPLDAREALAAIAERAPASGDLVGLLTCHRVELYAAVAIDVAPRAHIARQLGVAEPPLADGEIVVDAEAARHLFRVSCGLDSAVRGEGQILGQVRRTYDAARARHRLHPVLSEAFQTALRLARELRATSALGGVRRSVGSLAVDEALRLAPDAATGTALVVGAGEVGKLASRALRARVRRLVIANRDRRRAETLGAELGAQAVGLEGLDAALAEADVVISAADTRGALLTRERIAARVASAPLVLVDIAVPRSVDLETRSLPGLVYRSVDDFSSDADPALAAAMAEAEARCAAEAQAFLARVRGREAAATIRRLRGRAERVRREQLSRALAKLRHLDARDRDIVEAFSATLMNALLHDPTVALRAAPDRAEAAQELFGLGPE